MNQLAKVSDIRTSLFPILPAGLTGLAKMAAEAEHADDGHLVEFRNIQVRSVLNRSISKRLIWLAYSINPYRGCEFGCRYCYARYTHEFLAPKPDAEQDGEAGGTGNLRDPEAFERIIFLKQNAAWLLEQDLKRIDPEQQIALGTATDPYQPIERRARITRSLLEVFARKQGYRLGIVTKSNLIERDVDLLVEIGRRNKLSVHITITTPNAALARKMEPRAPRPDLRFRAVQRLREAGIKTGILCCPVLPGITDSEKALDGMARRAAAVSASFFAANPLFLKPCSRPTYMSFLHEHFPALVKDYEARFGKADFASQTYSRQLAKTVRLVCKRHGLNQRSADTLQVQNDSAQEPGRRPPCSAPAETQQLLFG
jgi:DNA repair photolyase